HEGGDVACRQLLERRHDTLGIALLDVRVRIDDRLVHELGQWLVRSFRVGRELVEVRADLPGGCCGLIRVAATATVRREERLTRCLLLNRPDDRLRERVRRSLAPACSDDEHEQAGDEKNGGSTTHGARVY